MWALCDIEWCDIVVTSVTSDQSEASIVPHWPIRSLTMRWMVWVSDVVIAWTGQWSPECHLPGRSKKPPPGLTHRLMSPQGKITLCAVVTLSHQAQDTDNYQATIRVTIILSRGLTRSGDINAILRIDHDWAWALEWRQLVCWELTKAAWAISTSDHLGPQSHTSLNTWEGLTLETNNHGKENCIFIQQDNFCEHSKTPKQTLMLSFGSLKRHVVNKRPLACGFDCWMCIRVQLHSRADWVETSRSGSVLTLWTRRYFTKKGSQATHNVQCAVYREC